RTMRAAQQLYEGIELASGETAGLITYMRTDSMNVSPQAQREARSYISKEYGDDYMPKKAKAYKTKSKGAQEAHEAIRPTSVFRTPELMKSRLSKDQYKLYELIWLRFVASQMSNAIYNTIRVEINAGTSSNDMPYLFRSSGSRIKFAGFLALYEDSKDEDDTTESDEGRIFPEMSDDEVLRLLQLLPAQHFTQPPPRYTEASLVRALEEYGIGRPSTYAPTVAVIQDRDYVNKENKRLVPTDVGKTVSDLLVEYFNDEMQYEFTAKMEGQLDEIADSNSDWRPVLRDFYDPFENRLVNARENMPVVKTEEKIGRICPTCNDGDLIIKYGRFGKFIGCTNYPECRHTEQFIEYVDVPCPTCSEEHGGELVVKKTRRGRTFYGCSRYPDCEYSTWKLPKKGSGDGDDEGEQEPEEELPLTS
ncbi:MAG: DNA topoisomerase, partial [Chloroflexota bacterium]